MNQSQILESLKNRLGTILSDVKGHLLAEIEDDELAVAERLLRINLRAAGAVAGRPGPRAGPAAGEHVRPRLPGRLARGRRAARKKTRRLRI